VNLLTLENVSKNFGGLRALSGVSFGIKKGKILGLIGPNGAGKTTLFNIISGFYLPDGGRIIFKGQNIVGLKPHQICKRGLARTFQIVKPLENLTVRHNIRIAAYNSIPSRKDAEREACDIMNFLGIRDKEDQLACNLTIGDRKRLEVARALATKPGLILLDEVMSGLTETEINDFLLIITKMSDMGITVLMIEHIMRVIMSVSHKVTVINYGEKIAEGKPKEITNNQKVTEAYLGEEDGVATG
jgi:branched-chain amino acid transport system ATP-binding protein